ncbi:acireductone dioxygenase [Nocardiopsis sp. L17-MgMaSL7]|uniref:1,2-dihydroxy-3-keto-5-methylthiopentene dioxygenase n=1 Tax=Nocardiopsis sp. L17-MgMaSL7 TaxID=1938893 RepID=UPI000D714EF2|nr:cupin [Nocardiopsis sp. L17-MgMaSL7]PWV58086.1 1,2-dihydroxy-3-keto-5-methylthiopentene dioxygenase [Nocardiopsis sp. L17-MgMaSL7]
MTLLQIMPEHDASKILVRTSDPDRIARELSEQGVEFGRWDVPDGYDPDSDTERIMDCFRDRVERISAERSFRLVDVARLRPDDDPAWPEKAAEARSKFLQEHRHSENEVRFFASGSGCFYLHLGDRVYALVCTEGDLVSVPAGTRHWFDMGTRPDFVAVRFFEEKDGWVGDFTGDRISDSFPTLDDLVRTG